MTKEKARKIGTIIGFIIGMSLTLFLMFDSFSYCIGKQYDKNEYGVPMRIENNRGDVFEYVRPVNDDEVLFHNPFEEKTEIVFQDKWYRKIGR